MKTLIALSIVRYTILLSLLTFFINVHAQVQTPKYVSMISNSKAYYEYLPQGYSSGSNTYPLIIFITGIGELGDGSSSQLPKVLYNGTPKQINQGIFPNSFTVNGQTSSFIVISPQFVDWPTPVDINNIIDYAIQNYRVDVTRIYLTGLSMGGGVVWDYAGNNSTYANRIAAIVPISGASYPDVTRSQTMAAANLAVWATHNDGDGTVPSFYTVDYVNYINAAPTPPNPLAKKTIFSSTSHDAWTQTYDLNYKENGLNVYQWMLQYKRGTPSNQPPIANAGPDVNLTLPVNSVQINGSNSFDPDGTISFSWAKTSGPAQFTINNNLIVNPLISNLVAGTYNIRLTVTDNKGATATNDMNIIVSSTPPPPPPSGKTIPGKIEAENYDGKYSLMTQSTSDVGGGLNVGGLGNGSWMDYNVNVITAGTYTVNYRIATPYSGTQLQLKKSDGTVLSTVNLPQTPAWQSYTTVSSTAILPAGNQTLKVYVSKASFNFNWLEFVSTAPPSNQSPVANAGADKTITLPTNSATLSGSGTDADGTISSYLWSQISGPSASTIGSATTAQTTMSNLIKGTYVYQLKVTDNKGATGTDMLQVVVNPASPPISGVTKYINVNVYGGSNPYNNSAWNNWNVGTGSATNITSGLFKYSDGTSSSVNSVLSYTQALGDNAATYPGGMAPSEVLRYTSYSLNARTLTVSGLSASVKYSIELYASRWSSGNSTIFTVNGISTTITTYRNFTNKAVFANISPNAAGQIVVSLKSSTYYNYLNGFMITEQGSGILLRPLPDSVNTLIVSAATNSSALEEDNYLNGSKIKFAEIPSVEVFPNPVNDKIVMQVNNKTTGIMHVQIISANGVVKKELKLKHDLPFSQINIPVNELPAGIYIIKIQIGKWSASKKIIKS